MLEPDNDQEDPKCKQKGRGKKRKRVSSESSTDDDVLPENTLDVEKSVHASAIKNNLDDVSVKKILKKVVTNDHVLALVKLREEEEDSGTEEKLRPKLTRAKAKELMKVSPKSVPWNLELTPIKHIPVKTRPEVTALIAQELPDDEDDDEYEPTNDDVPSDDDHVLESSSDVDSLPRTPVTPRSQKKVSPKVVNDGPFKVPQEMSTPARRKLDMEEATIALRTRSKLSLSATSIEHIESSFVPPDDLPVADVDSLWNNFLSDCLNPASNARNEDDDETDPEYSVAADPDANEEDEESLENSIIKISRKELNDLMTELFSIVPDGTSDPLADTIVQEVLTEPTDMPPEVPTRWEGKQEPVSDEDNTPACRAAPVAVKRERFSIGKSETPDADSGAVGGSEANPSAADATPQESTPADAPAPAPSMPLESSTPNLSTKTVSSADTCVTGEAPTLVRDVFETKTKPIRIEIKANSCHMSAEHRLLLQQQLRQHVQLAASCFLQLFVHPTHWARAPCYKEFLKSLNNMAEKNPHSVVNVCNLKPAMELIASWETSVSASTEENLKMVEFIQKEMDRSRRRSAQNSYYVGDFPELFLEVVSNSTVFLYPYLLPAMPFRPESPARRNIYLQSEDALIALGLDQFWDYVVSNPDIFKPPARSHPRHRWGLVDTLVLVSKHMMPWNSPKTLLAHVRHVRRSDDKDNPIFKFFATRKVEPVKHRLLPYNPRLTLYEQPEHEVPRIWLRHLAKTSKRFKRYLFGRKSAGVSPAGVDIEVSREAPMKKPLPIDFTKEINCYRLNLLPPKIAPNLVDRVDVPISKQTTAPVACQPLVAKDIFTVINTSTGSFLVPVSVSLNTVNSTAAPGSTPTQDTTEKLPVSNDAGDVLREDSEEIEGTKTAERSNPISLSKEESNDIQPDPDLGHCSCCVLLRKICKRQRTILDYFKRSKGSSKCGCEGRTYPRMTNRLRLLLKNYKVHSQNIFSELQSKINAIDNKLDSKVESASDSVICDDEENDLVRATLFQLKLTMTSALVRNNYIKKRIHTLFSKFDVEKGDVLNLATSLFKICEKEMVPLYKEFVGFLTAEQADQLGHFKDYFLQRSMDNLIKKVEELIPDKQQQRSVLSYLQSGPWAGRAGERGACAACTALMQAVRAQPALARHVFDAFPHRRETNVQEKDSNKSSAEIREEPTAEAQPAMDYEADDSSCGEDGEKEDIEEERHDPLSNEDKEFINEHEHTPMKFEEEEINKVNLPRTTEASSETSEMSRLVMSDDDTVKSEGPEWRREEDKVILEMLKDHIVPEERKDNTILEVLEGTQVLSLISESLPHKTVCDVKERVLYLLQLLVGGFQ